MEPPPAAAGRLPPPSQPCHTASLRPPAPRSSPCRCRAAPAPAVSHGTACRFKGGVLLQAPEACCPGNPLQPCLLPSPRSWQAQPTMMPPPWPRRAAPWAATACPSSQVGGTAAMWRGSPRQPAAGFFLIQSVAASEPPRHWRTDPNASASPRPAPLQARRVCSRRPGPAWCCPPPRRTWRTTRAAPLSREALGTPLSAPRSAAY